MARNNTKPGQSLGEAGKEERQNTKGRNSFKK